MTRVVQRLAAIGKQLAHPPHTKDAILKQLKQAAEMLSEMKQSHDVKASIEPLTRALAIPMLIKHKDKDVRLFTITCTMEILRIVAPDAPYSDKELQEIFREVVSAFEGLDETSSSSFARRTTILEIMANLRICVVMLDVGCDDLILEMFRIFFSVVSDRHPPSVLTAMQTIMAAVLEEIEKISLPLLDTILNNLLKHKTGVSSAAHKLAVGVVQQCAGKLEPYVQRLLTSVMLEGRAAEINLHADYHDIIHEIYQCAPQMLLAVIPNLTQELVNDQVNVRLKAVKLLGRLFALPGQHVAKEYRQLFLEFLKRFTDKSAEVRLAMIDCAKDCLKVNPSGCETSEILAGLDDRILDSEEAIRLRTVVVICDVAKHNFKWIPVSLLKHVAERLRDKKVLVRKEAFQRLADVYRAYTTKCYDGFVSIDNQLEWIPGKLLRCCYDKDVKEFRPAALEILLTEKLFLRQVSVFERIKHWIVMYSVFEDIDKKALAKVISQKKRLQEDVSKFLSLREKEKGSGHEDPQIQQLFKAMSLLFVDDGKVEEHFQKLHNMKDKKIFKALSQLLDQHTSFRESEAIKEDLLKRIGEHHPQHEFMKVLALRCSFMIFGKEHAKSVLEEVALNQDSSKDTAAAGLSLLAEFAGFFPFLIQDVKEDLLGLLLEGDATIKERVADILARAGNSVRGQIEGVGSSIELTLQKLCLEGTRKQAKYSVSALTAVNTDEGFKALSVLYGRLIEQLQEDNPHLPAVLQSLSCIAETAISIFETQEDDIVRFVVRSLLQKDSVSEVGSSEHGDWGSLSKVCQLKIFGLKTLVKSFLPHKQHPRRRLRGLLGLLSKLLPNGEISETSRSREIDKAHLRLASVKGLLRLARRWDAQIPPPLFHLCLLTAQDSCINVRQGFLRKLHQFLKDHTLNHKYACGYALFAVDSSKDILADAKHHLVDFIESARLEARTQQKSVSQTDASPITYKPEYVLTYLVHVLAHHPSFPGPESETADVYEPFYRILLFYLRPLVAQENEGLGKGDGDNLPAILAIFRTIKKAEDALEGNKTANLHIVCDLGIVITKELGSSILYSDTYPGLIPLPSSLYTVKTNDADDVCKVDGSDLPGCLTDSEVLSQLWTRGSRPGQMHPLGSNQHSKKVKKDAEESSSSDQNGIDARKQMETRSSESVQVTSEIAKISRNGYKVQQKKVLRQGKTESRTAEEAGTSIENDLVKGGKVIVGSPGTSGRHKVNGSVIQSEDGFLASEKGERPTRVTRSQAVGMRIVTGSKAGKIGLSSPEPERGQNDRSSVVMKKTVAKRLKLDKQSDPVRDGAVENPSQHHEGQLSSGEEEDKRPQTRSRKAAAEVQPNLRSNTPTRKGKAFDVKVNVSEGGERSDHAANGIAEALGIQASVAEKVKSPDATSEGRVLRKRSKTPTGNQKVPKKPSTGSDESDQEETTATWRSRRRKVQ